MQWEDRWDADLQEMVKVHRRADGLEVHDAGGSISLIDPNADPMDNLIGWGNGLDWLDEAAENYLKA